MSPATKPKAEPLWVVIRESVRGASHEVSGDPNEDFAGSSISADRKAPVVLAVSDGHGADIAFRSSTGSRLAVETAKRLAAQVTVVPSGMTPSVFKRELQRRLPRLISDEWMRAVAADVAANPFTKNELDALADADPEGRKQLEHDPKLAYGATLLLAVIGREMAVYAQIGDGDLIAFDSDQNPLHPIPSDERLVGTETTSLCVDGAWTDFRTVFAPICDDPPLLVTLSSDGLANSFASETDFVSDLKRNMQAIRAGGREAFEAQLAGRLAAISKAGSGDDISLCLAKRVEKIDADELAGRIDRVELQLARVAQKLVAEAPRQATAVAPATVSAGEDDLKRIKSEVGGLATRLKAVESVAGNIDARVAEAFSKTGAAPASSAPASPPTDNPVEKASNVEPKSGAAFWLGLVALALGLGALGVGLWNARSLAEMRAPRTPQVVPQSGSTAPPAQKPASDRPTSPSTTQQASPPAR